MKGAIKAFDEERWIDRRKRWWRLRPSAQQQMQKAKSNWVSMVVDFKRPMVEIYYLKVNRQQER